MPYIAVAPRPETYKRARAMLQYVNAQTGEPVGVSQLAKFLGVSSRTVYNTIDTYPEIFRRVQGMVETRFAQMPTAGEVIRMREETAAGAPTYAAQPAPVEMPAAPTTQPTKANPAGTVPVTTYSDEQAKEFASLYPATDEAAVGLFRLACRVKAASLGKPLPECNQEVAEWLGIGATALRRAFEGK